MLILGNQLGVINNSYQGKHFKVLTVCSAGCLRSPTAAHILSSEPWNFNTRCCGTSKEYAIIPLTHALVQWADEIIVFDEFQYKIVMDFQHDLSADMGDSMYGDFEYKRIHNLYIEDDYGYRDPELVRQLIVKFKEIY